MMSPEDQELDEYLDGISFTDDKDRDWRDVPELGDDPDEDDEEVTVNADDDEDEDDNIGLDD